MVSFSYIIYMKSIFIYPPTLEKYHTRLRAFFVVVICSSILVLNYFQNFFDMILTIILWLDFLICFAISPEYSFLKPIINISHKKWIHKEQWISSKPKRFATFCGFFILTLAIVFYFLNSSYFSMFVAIHALFSFLDAGFDFCVACKIYGIGQKLGLIPEDTCENC